MSDRNTAEIISFEEIRPRLGLKTRVKPPRPTVTIVFWFDPEEYDYSDDLILHVAKVFVREEDAKEYCEKRKETHNLTWRTYFVE